MPRACFVIAILLTALAPVPGRAWQRAYVVDARIAALRTDPDLTALVAKRLRAGRMVAVVERRRDRTGTAWLRVAVTRRTRGWLLADAVAWPGDRAGERRLAARIDAERGLARIQVARLAADRFPRLRQQAAAALEVEATVAASRLSRAVARRLGPLAGATDDEVRTLMLSAPELDRYNRLGLRFDVDLTRRAYVPLAARP